MGLIKNLKIRSKLLLSFTVIIIITAVVGMLERTGEQYDEDARFVKSQ